MLNEKYDLAAFTIMSCATKFTAARLKILVVEKSHIFK